MTRGRSVGSVRRRIAGVRRRLEGPQTVGASRAFWAGLVVLVCILVVLPVFSGQFGVLTQTNFLTWVLLAVSLSIVWGYAGIISFGQNAFFGLGAYAFGVIGINLIDATGTTYLALVGAILVPMAFAAVLGYFMFYGGISDVYVLIVTLVVPLILELVLSQTAAVSIGEAVLGGSTGMSNIPSLSLVPSGSLGVLGSYYLTVILVVCVYLGLRYLLNSDIGYVIVAIREDAPRTEMFGYNVQWIKLQVFTLAAGLAGLAGALFAASSRFVDPTVMGIAVAALPVFWVIVGGRETLAGAIVGAYLLQYVDFELTSVGAEYSAILLAVILLGVVLFFPNGIVPSVTDWIGARPGPSTPTAPDNDS